MGLISYFKDLHYNNKLERAEKLLAEGNASEAESILNSILDKHPLAASKLAAYYCSIGVKSNADTMIKQFNQAVSLKAKSGTICDVNAYDDVLKNFSQKVLETGKSYFESSSYVVANSLLYALNETNYKSSESVSLGHEAKTNILLAEIEASKSTDTLFNTKIQDFKNEWLNVKSIPRAKNSCVACCDRLESGNRFFASIAILSEILEDEFKSRILDNAVKIIYGEDSEASSAQIRKTVTKYGKANVLRDEKDVDTALSLFNACWDKSSSPEFIIDVLQSCKSIALRGSFISSILSNHAKFLTRTTLLSDLCRWLLGLNESKYASDVLEQLNGLGYDVQGYYVTKIHAWIISMSCDEKISILDHAQSLFPDDDKIISDKYACAQWYLDNNEDRKAISVSESIIPKLKKAEIVKAKALCNLAHKENDADTKVSLLKQASNALSNNNGKEFLDARAQISDELIDAANLYYNSGNRDKCYEILHDIGNQGYEKSVFSIAKLRFEEARSSSSPNDKYDIARAAIKELRSFNSTSITGNADYKTLWDEYVKAFIEIKKSEDNKTAVSDLESLHAEVTHAGFSKAVLTSITGPITKELIRRKYLIARDLELGGEIGEAAECYREISSLESSKNPTLAALRFFICKLKGSNSSVIISHKDNIYSLLRNSAEAFKSEKEDVAYRFALTLLRSGEDKEALQVISEFLPNEVQLKKACMQGDMIKAQAKLEDFNAKLDAVKAGTLSSDDALYFINHMLEYSEVISPVLSLPRSTLSRYRNKLKNYAIFKLFDEGKYDVAFEKMVKEHPDYLDDLTALRNIALTCLNMAESKQISLSNYQDVISVWLTAIYQERLFVKSLDYTSWDDQFTFSLYDAYGHFNESTLGDLPDNVNFDDSDDSNLVFIKEVQTALLNRFEAAISDDQLFHSFYTSQKDALDAFIALNLDEKCRIVTPYLAKRNDSIYEDISAALERDREQEYDNWEDVLSVGATYQMTEAIYTDYSNAKVYFDQCMEAIDSHVVSHCKSAFTLSKVVLINKFDKLYSALVSYANSKVSSLSAKDNSEFKSNFNVYMVVCSALKDRTVSFCFSKYVMSFVVGEVNGKKMTLAEAADYILSIFLLDKNNSKVKENLSTLFEMLIEESSQESTHAVSVILSKVQAVDSSLYVKFYNENEQAKIDQELNEIIKKVNSNQMSKSSALVKVYDMYNNKHNNGSICENLAQLSDICIMEYVVALAPGHYLVEQKLENLKTNASLEFKKHCKIFKTKYNTIWNSLSMENKLLLTNESYSAVLGKSLNEKGMALKKGLAYYKYFGDLYDDYNTVHIR